MTIPGIIEAVALVLVAIAVCATPAFLDQLRHWWRRRPRYVVCRNVSWGPYPRAKAQQLAQDWDQTGWDDCGPHRVRTRLGRRLNSWRSQ